MSTVLRPQQPASDSRTHVHTSAHVHTQLQAVASQLNETESTLSRVRRHITTQNHDFTLAGTVCQVQHATVLHSRQRNPHIQDAPHTYWSHDKRPALHCENKQCDEQYAATCTHGHAAQSTLHNAVRTCPSIQLQPTLCNICICICMCLVQAYTQMSRPFCSTSISCCRCRLQTLRFRASTSTPLVLVHEWVVCVSLDWVCTVECVTVILGPWGIHSNALGQVRVGDEVAACRKVKV
jgi:hypothetical protein